MNRTYTLTGIPFVIIVGIPWVVGVVTIVSKLLS